MSPTSRDSRCRNSAAKRSAKRRIGLGVTGLADALILVRHALRLARIAARSTELWMSAIQRAAYLASSRAGARERRVSAVRPRQISRRRGDPRAAGRRARRDRARRHRATRLLTSIAPTGTISLLRRQCLLRHRAGVRLKLHAAVLLPDGGRREEEVSDHAYRLYRRLKGTTRRCRSSFVDAQHLAPEAIMSRCRRRCRNTSTARSRRPSTARADIAFEAFKDVYRQAYELGCKGCTTYRPNEITGAVLSTRDAAPEREAEPELPLAQDRDRARQGRVRSGRRRLHDPAARPARGAAGPAPTRSAGPTASTPSTSRSTT